MACRKEFEFKLVNKVKKKITETMETQLNSFSSVAHSELYVY